MNQNINEVMDVMFLAQYLCMAYTDIAAILNSVITINSDKL